MTNLFLVNKKYEGNTPVINLKNLNECISHNHLKMESLQLLMDILKKGDFMCKLIQKMHVFSFNLWKSHRNLQDFCWKGAIYQFPCQYFGITPATYVFNVLFKIPIAFLWRIGTLIIIHLEEVLLTWSTVNNIQIYPDTMILLLEKLGLVINLKMSVMTASC